MPPTILFASGGTGGHIFPALAVADALDQLIPGVRCNYLCSAREIDARVLSSAGADFNSCRAQPFSVGPRGLARFVWNWGGSVREARALVAGRVEGFERADAVVATGGFVAAPAARAARAERVPFVLLNLDAIPGKANRWVARHAAARLTTADSPAVPASWTRIPPIVRPQAVGSLAQPQARERFGLDADRPTLLVTGGSQGARSVNQLVAAFLELHADIAGQWQLIHQCGPGAADELRARYAALGIPHHVCDFIDDIGEAWAAADFAVGRAGAGTVAEAWANRVPTLFLPYPHHRDNHQRHNARPLEEAGVALIQTDHVTPDENLASTGPLLEQLMTTPSRLDEMRAAFATLGPADGAERAAQAVSDLLAS